jgi:hypothetical protein
MGNNAMALKLQRVAPVFLFVLLAYSPLRADPIIPTTGLLQITSGEGFVRDSDSYRGPIVFAGEGFRFEGELDNSAFRVSPQFVPPFNPSHSLAGEIGGILRIGDAGLAVPGSGFPSPFNYLIHFTGSAESVQTFPNPEIGEIRIIINYPFRFSGVLVGMLNGVNYRYELEGRGRGRLEGLRAVESVLGRAQVRGKLAALSGSQMLS